MSTVLKEENQQKAGRGIKDFAEDIEYLIGFSSKPQTYDDIENHFEADEKYFESDLDHIKEALDYLEEKKKEKKRFQARYRRT